MQSKIKRILEKMYIVIFSFLAIYQPPILSVNILNFLFIISIIHILFNLKKFIKFSKNNFKVKNILLLMIIGIYSLCIHSFIKNDLLLLYSNLILPLENIWLAIYIFFYIKNHGYSRNEIVMMLFIIVFIQAMTSLLMFCIPQFQKWFITICIRNGFSKKIIQLIENHRFYGFSSDLTFIMPIVQVISAFIILNDLSFDNCFKNKKINCVLKTLSIVIIFFSAIINARISILIIIIYLLIYLINNWSNIKNNNTLKKKLLVTVFVVIVITLSLITVNNIWHIASLNWIFKFFTDIFDLFAKKDISNNTFYYLFSGIKVPNGINLIFGKGVNAFTNMECRSDIGYIINLWYGGLFYCIILYYLTFKFFLKDFLKFKKNDLLNIFLLIVFFVSNIKGNVFMYSGLVSLSVVYILLMRTKIDGGLNEN